MANPSSGKLPGYETTYITRSEMTDEGLKALNERIVNIIGNYKGEVVLTEDWGRRKLAYPIQKETRGQYTYVVYTGTGDIVHEIERNLRLHEHVLRFLSVNLEKEFDIENFRKRRTELQAAAKKREEEREARREERAAERRSHEGRGGYEHRGYERHHQEPAEAPAAEGASEE